MAEHDFSLSPDECPACQEGRSRRSHKPAAVPGIADINGTVPGLGVSIDTRKIPSLPRARTDNEVLAAAERAAYSAIEKRRAEEAAKRATAASWDAVVSELNRNNQSSSGGHGQT